MPKTYQTPIDLPIPNYESSSSFFTFGNTPPHPRPVSPVPLATLPMPSPDDADSDNDITLASICCHPVHSPIARLPPSSPSLSRTWGPVTHSKKHASASTPTTTSRKHLHKGKVPIYPLPLFMSIYPKRGHLHWVLLPL